ncbi:unnamed protein product [Darwinula stevensoni]|uniref:Methyltransferase type 11 domain-containing protein n=1 Tax=Darwinula stevensoni TaxID=69355 RepID=A0A7R8ZZ87_9CRUS|nr:unnamed protein product [Darwinula stevensoni]CAG0883051.1 unnamed protein product [Darwinula stevensoni]
MKSASPAEALPFPPCSVQLVTASRSFHYFHQSRFLDEAKRVLAPSGVLAIFNCGLLPVGFPTLGRDRSDALSSALRHVDGLMTDYWTDARSTFSLEDFQLPMNEAKTFRFGEIHSDISMDADGLVGYVQTWSAYGRMKEKEGKDRMDAIASDLRRRQDRLRQRFSLGSNPFPDDLWSPPSQVGEGAVPR